MTKNTLIVSNWKMNLNLINAKKLISKLKSLKNFKKYKKYCMSSVFTNSSCKRFN